MWQVFPARGGDFAPPPSVGDGQSGRLLVINHTDQYVQIRVWGMPGWQSGAQIFRPSIQGGFGGRSRGFLNDEICAGWGMSVNGGNVRPVTQSARWRRLTDGSECWVLVLGSVEQEDGLGDTGNGGGNDAGPVILQNSYSQQKVQSDGYGGQLRVPQKSTTAAKGPSSSVSAAAVSRVSGTGSLISGVRVGGSRLEFELLSTAQAVGGPLIVQAQIRSNSGEPWRMLHSWSDVAAIPSGAAVSRSYDAAADPAVASLFRSGVYLRVVVKDASGHVLSSFDGVIP